LNELKEFFDDARPYAKAKMDADKKHQPEKVPAWEAMIPFVHGDAPIFVHADDKRQIKAVLKWAKDNAFKIILVGGGDSWMFAKEIAAQKIPVVYEHIYDLPTRDSDRYDVNFRAPKILREAGVTLALGMGATTFDAALVKNLPYTVAQGIAFGLPEADALRSITIIPAQMLGVENQLGSIEPGKEATLVAADGNIFDIRSHVKHVWIAGKEVSLETRHTRLYEKYKNRPKTK
jgi:imidazolonepropionase-like amidohydrolase